MLLIVPITYKSKEKQPNEAQIFYHKICLRLDLDGKRKRELYWIQFQICPFYNDPWFSQEWGGYELV